MMNVTVINIILLSGKSRYTIAGAITSGSEVIDAGKCGLSLVASNTDSISSIKGSTSFCNLAYLMTLSWYSIIILYFLS